MRWFLLLILLTGCTHHHYEGDRDEPPEKHATPTRAPTVAPDPAPALEHLDLLAAVIIKFIPEQFDNATLAWSIEGLTQGLHIDLQYGPDLTTYGRSCDAAHTKMRSLIRSWIRTLEAMVVDDWDEVDRERVRGRDLAAQAEESTFRCQRGR